MADDSPEADASDAGTGAAGPAVEDDAASGDDESSDAETPDAASGTDGSADGDATAADPTAGDAEPRAADAGTGATGGSMRSREVVVPMRLYKTVTVFTTLFSALLVVAGFIILDVATNRARASLDEVDPVLAVLGLACIAAGGLLYAFASRFRAAGMGKDKDDADEPSDNG